jgi:uncharacterized membrane protein
MLNRNKTYFCTVNSSASTRHKYFLWAAFLLFALIYSSISLVNHYCFRTFGWDLGIFNSALFDYSHLRFNHSTIHYPELLNLLSDHFEAYPLFFAPFRFIFGTWTLLILQIASILFGGLGIYRYLSLRTANERFALVGVIHFLLCWGIYSALSFDYHNNVVAAMLVPWFFYYYEQRKFKLALLFFTLFILGKENIALWAVFICFGLFIKDYKDSEKRRWVAAMGIFALIYFVAMIKCIMPSFENYTYYYINLYKPLGTSLSEILQTIITRPLYTLKIFFINTTSDPSFDWIKLELYLFMLFCGGFAFFLRPVYLIMLLPILGQKMLCYTPERWGINYQYSIELAPILTIALFEVLNSKLKNKKLITASIICVLISGAFTIHSFFKRQSTWFVPDQLQFFSKKHYQQNFNIAEVYNGLKIIPDNFSVSAQTELCPHLAFRDTIYLYPDVRAAKYIVLLRNKAAYPLSYEEHSKKIDQFLTSSEWQTIYNKNNLLIFKRN